MKKGSIANVIPMMGVLLASVLFTFQSIPVSNAFSGELTESISDLNRVAQTKSVADLYLYNQVPMAASHSVHQASYKIASNGGKIGLDYVTWTNTGIGESSLFGSIRNTISVNFIGETDNIFRSKYLSQPEAFGDCSINQEGFSLSIPTYQQSTDTIGIAGEVNPGGELEVTCESSSGSTKYMSEFVLANFKAEDNRFYQLTDDTVSFFEDLRDSWNQVDKVRSSSRTCGRVLEDQYKNRENAAAAELQNEISNRLSSVLGNYPTYNGFEIVKAETVDYTNSMTYDTYSGANYKGYSIPDRERVGSCDCGFRCTEPKYEYWVDVYPQESRLEWSLKDIRYRIPVEDGWKNMHFNVSTYNQSY